MDINKGYFEKLQICPYLSAYDHILQIIGKTIFLFEENQGKSCDSCYKLKIDMKVFDFIKNILKCNLFFNVDFIFHK
jgi:hypothetical protein